MDYNNKNNFLCLSRLQAKDQKAIGVAMAKELLLNFIKKKKKNFWQGNWFIITELL